MVVNAGFFTCRLLTGKSEATGVASEKRWIGESSMRIVTVASRKRFKGKIISALSPS
jgi:thiazole synthase ThiGH ThiG subunit